MFVLPVATSTCYHGCNVYQNVMSVSIVLTEFVALGVVRLKAFHT